MKYLYWKSCVEFQMLSLLVIHSQLNIFAGEHHEQSVFEIKNIVHQDKTLWAFKAKSVELLLYIKQQHMNIRNIGHRSYFIFTVYNVIFSWFIIFIL